MKAYRDQLAKERQDIDRQRAEALYKAANDEENSLVSTQEQIGQELAKDNDYSVLGKLYGLTQDQIDRIQGTGAYAPRYIDFGNDMYAAAYDYRSFGGGNGGGNSGGSKTVTSTYTPPSFTLRDQIPLWSTTSMAASGAKPFG